MQKEGVRLEKINNKDIWKGYKKIQLTIFLKAL